MNKKHIRVTDSFKVSDKNNDKNTAPVKGVVVLKDENGKIIFKKNNLVVYDGREMVMNLFLNAFRNNNESLNLDFYGVDSGSISVRVGSNTGVTQSDTSLTDFSNDSVEYEPTISVIPKDLGIKFSVNIIGSGLNAINMSELGLVLKYYNINKDGSKDENQSEKLFSRIVFDPLPFTSNNTYMLDYYLYF